MKNKKLVKTLIWIAVSGIVIAAVVVFYMFNMPHRDVQKAKTDYAVTSSQIVKEYLSDNEAANLKYLAEDGNSRILEVTGTVNKTSKDFDGNTVVLLKNNGDKAGVNCMFSNQGEDFSTQVKEGDKVTVKGVIRSGAGYDEDLDLYENVILDHCKIVSK